MIKGEQKNNQRLAPLKKKKKKKGDCKGTRDLLLYRPSVRAETFAVDGRACAAVLAPAGRGAALTVRPIRTRIVAPIQKSKTFFPY